MSAPRRLMGLGPVFAPGPVWMLFACVVAAVLGGWQLGDPGLWCDEIYTARWARLDFPALISALRVDLHPPLYFLLEAAVVRVVGGSEAGLRILSLAAGVATVAASYWAFRPVLNERLCAATAWMLALCPQFFLYSRMARYYALAALLAVLAHGLFVRLAVKRGGPRSWLLYGLSVAALLYTSYVAVCLVLAHFVWAVGARRRRPRLWKAWIAAAAGGFLLFLPWLAALVQQVQHAKGLLPSVVSGPAGLALMLAFDLHALTATELQAPWTAAGIAGLAGGTALLALGALAAVRRGLGRSVLVPSLTALGLAWLVIGTMAHATPFVGLPARTLFMWPFAAVVLAIAALDPVYPRVLRIGLCGALLIAWASGWVNLHRAEGWMNPIYLTPGREVAESIRSRLAPGDALLAEDDTGAPYYLLEGPAHVVPFADPVMPTPTRALLSDPWISRIWYVRLSRDGSQRVLGDHEAGRKLSRWGGLVEEQGWLAIDPTYQEIKRRLTGLPGYSHRIVVQLWQRPAATGEPPSGATEAGTPAPPGR